MQLAMNTQELVMDVGTVLDGDEAVAEGLIDTLGNLHEAMDCLDAMIAAARKSEVCPKTAVRPFYIPGGILREKKL